MYKVFKILVICFIWCISVSPVGHCYSKIDEQWDRFERYRDQFDDIIINGMSANDVIRRQFDQFFPVIKDEYSEEVRKFNEKVRACDNLLQQEISHRNIYHKELNDLMLAPNVLDYATLGNEYLHRFNERGYLLYCSHYSKDALYEHARLMIQHFNDNNKIGDEKRRFSEEGRLAFVRERLLPRYYEALIPFENEKKNQMQKIVEETKLLIKSYNCNAVTNPNPSYPGFFQYCKKLKQCELKVTSDEDGVVGLGCACKHYLSEHSIKAKEIAKVKSIFDQYEHNQYEHNIFRH